MAGSLKKGYIGKEDLKVQVNTDAAETFQRLGSVGGTETLTKFPDIWNGTGMIDIAKIEADETAGDALGDRTYTEDNYVTDEESFTDSIDTLDQEVKDVNDVLLPKTFLLGFVRGFEISRKDADEVYVSGGALHVNDGTTDHFLTSVAQITKAITGHGQTDVPIYFYVDAPASGTTLATADIEWNATAPTWSHAKKGWYHPTTTDFRFVGSIPVDGSGNLIEGYRSGDGNYWEFETFKTLGTSLDDTSFTDIANIGKFIPHIDNAVAFITGLLTSSDNGNAKVASLRKNGSSDSTGRFFLGLVGKTGDQKAYGTIKQIVDVSGKAEYKISNDTNTTLNLYASGYWEPR